MIDSKQTLNQIMSRLWYNCARKRTSTNTHAIDFSFLFWSNSTAADYTSWLFSVAPKRSTDAVAITRSGLCRCLVGALVGLLFHKGMFQSNTSFVQWKTESRVERFNISGRLKQIAVCSYNNNGNL